MITKEMADRLMEVARYLDGIERRTETPERQRTTRRNAVIRGLADGALEGMTPTPELLTAVQQYAAGEISMEQMCREMLDRARENGEVER